tara:strand:- start:3213 stop:4205 length:993 start_codon:yes stop_codon:yes gene_type:complete
MEYSPKIICTITLVSIWLIIAFISIFISKNRNKSCENYVKSKEIYVLDTTENELENNYENNYQAISQKVGNHTYYNDFTDIDLSIKSWNLLTSHIMKIYDYYDAFIIVINKDKLLYTSCAMSFIIENLTKPIVFISDNLSNALHLVSGTKICEVMILYSNRFYRATRMTTNNKKQLINTFQPLNEKNSFSIPKDFISIKYINNNLVVPILKDNVNHLYFLKNILDQQNETVQGILINSQTFSVHLEIIEIIKQLVQKGIIIVLTTDNVNIVDIDIRLIEAGVLNACNMTIYSAYTKLLFCITQIQEKKLIGKIMDMDLRGEIKPKQLLHS